MKYLNIITYFLSLIVALLLIFILAVDQDLFKLKQKIYKTYPNIELRKFVFKKNSIMHHFNNDYNIKFLPKTQFENIKLNKKKIIFDKNYYEKLKNKETISYKRYGTFFIDSFDTQLVITDYLGSIYVIDNFENVINQSDDLNPKKLQNNLSPDRVFDSLIFNSKIYVSYSINQNDCNKIVIDFADLQQKNLKFKNFFKSDECNDQATPGKMQVYENESNLGLIFSISEGSYNKPGKNIQKKDSIFGKILFIPFKDPSTYLIFSMGHRVIQGLYSDKEIIISTEHGPRGGDEINKIVKNGNYGWPIASFGERYDFKYGENKIGYKKNHLKENFIDPIFSFIEGIGISEIIRLPKEFSMYYDDHFVLASLNGNNLYFIRFNHNYEKILTLEKVFIGSRIRDLEYFKRTNTILLALEEIGEIGIISNTN